MHPNVSLATRHHYRPQRSCGQGYVFTRVRNSVHRGGSPWSGGISLPGDPPGQGRPPHKGEPPGTRENPPGPGRPPGTRDPLDQRPPRNQRPPLDQADPPLGSRRQHTVNEQPVRILLECILVLSSNICVRYYCQI